MELLHHSPLYTCTQLNYTQLLLEQAPLVRLLWSQKLVVRSFDYFCPVQKRNSRHYFEFLILVWVFFRSEISESNLSTEINWHFKPFYPNSFSKYCKFAYCSCKAVGIVKAKKVLISMYKMENMTSCGSNLSL